MAIIGIQIDRTNPEFTASDFTFWMPQYSNYIATQEGTAAFNKIYSIVNQKIFKSIFGSDWELAMSYGIAHYLTLIANQLQAPSGNTLQGIAGGMTHGVLSSATVGSFSKSYDLNKTMVSEDDALFWNQTSFGSALMALLKTKAVPSIMVVTSNPIPGAN
jgi:hypothetical protein